jgi:U3 small nucleolar RNA-associated protein 3
VTCARVEALLTYATTLAFYLHLRATEKYAARPELLRRHPILKRLLTLKEGINTLENLGVSQDVSEDNDDGEDEDEEDGDLWSLIKKKGLESGELAALLEDADLSPSPSPSPPPPRAKKRDTTKKEHAESRSKTKTKTRKTPAAVHDQGTGPVFDLVEPDYASASSRKTKVVPVVDADPYGEVTTLAYHDLSDKQARKKSLRFHVSRIESSSSRRSNARANAIGGDDDIPYRARKKEREARSEKEKERRKEKGLLGAGGDDLDGVDPEVSGEQKKRKRKRDEDSEDGGGYYDLVKQATATKKARKKAEYEAVTARCVLVHFPVGLGGSSFNASRPELDPEDTSGPRSVTRAILKNKGLTPHRSKAVRNPRVKKRQRYEQAKKKVASQKAVYKGGIGDVSKYSGEQSGISKVVKSVRL